MILLALYERSREHCDGAPNHPDFSAYVRMLDLAKGVCLPDDVVAYLRETHGAAVHGVIPSHTSNWSPLSAASPSLHL